MRQDKMFARILLILLVANVTLAAPAIVRRRHLDVAKAASEKRAGSEDDPLDKSASGSVSEPMPDLGSSGHLSDSGSSGHLPDPTDFGSENYLALDSPQETPQETPPESPHNSLSGSWPGYQPDSSESDDDRRPMFGANPPPRNWQLHGQDSEPPAGSSVGSAPEPPSDSDGSSLQDSAAKSSATSNGFFNDELRRKVSSAWRAVSAGVISGLKKIGEMFSPRAYVCPLFPRSPVDIYESQIF